MMCGHCEMRVQKALESIDGVQSAVADHEKGVVTVTLCRDTDDSVLIKAVEDQGYKVKS